MVVSKSTHLLDVMWFMSSDTLEAPLPRLLVADAADVKHPLKIITQSSVIKFIHSRLPDLGHVVNQTVGDCLLKKGHPTVTVKITQTALDAFRLIKTHKVSAVAVIGTEGLPVGTVSVKDARVMFTNPQALQLMTQPLKDLLKEIHKSTMAIIPDLLCVTPEDTVSDVVNKLVKNGVHRVWIVDKMHLVGVVSLRDVISLFVTPPPSEPQVPTSPK